MEDYVLLRLPPVSNGGMTTVGGGIWHGEGRQFGKDSVSPHLNLAIRNRNVHINNP